MMATVHQGKSQPLARTHLPHCEVSEYLSAIVELRHFTDQIVAHLQDLES
jgi:hypothetical protein